MAGIRIDVQVTDQVTVALQDLSTRAATLRPVWDSIGKMLTDHTKLRFESSKAPDGQPWKPSQRAQREGGQTLRLSGDLMRSITHLAEDDGVMIGTNVPYAATHQFGRTVYARSAPIYRDLEAVLADRKAHQNGKSRFGASPFVKRSQATLETWHEIADYHIPARPFLGVDDADTEDMLDLISRYLTGDE